MFRSPSTTLRTCFKPDLYDNAGQGSGEKTNLLAPSVNGTPLECETRAMCQSSKDDLSYLRGDMTDSQLMERRQARADGAITGLSIVEGGLAIRGAMGVARALSTVTRQDLIRFGRTPVSNQLIKGRGAVGATPAWAIRGGGGKLPFHYHIHRYNWYKPWTWFQYTPIIKP